MVWYGLLLSWLDVQQECDVWEFVWGVVGFQDEVDFNFQFVLNFVWFNFRFYCFLDVNSYKIEKIIEGIYEKFIIYFDFSKVVSWKRLIEEFLNVLFFSIKEIKIDVYYFILLFFLCLLDFFLNSNYVEILRDKEVEKKDDFDWGKYLMEGEEMDIGFYMDILNWFEESEEENDQLFLSREDFGIQVDRILLEE